MITVNGNALGARGFDAAVATPGDDTLGRWAFAKEIYGIATTGPQEWSVRIGVYGEWGTGKTSVLDMVASMAENDGHILVRFNPWEFTDTRDLWHAFVQAVIANIPKDALDDRKRRWQLWKKPAAPLAKWIAQHDERITKLADSKKIGTVLLGLDILKGFLFSNRSDLERLLKDLGDRRLIILIDDLDRASSKVVPEMLFAIKELMHVGGFAFVCAFDPVVVGKVLGECHKGFDDGLKFLEKIIDYPRWLPPPTDDGLLQLAQADAAVHCPYVPEQALKTAMPLMPKNPRAVRQFIRLLALLRPQIERHRADELNWPIILAANVIKIRFPRLAHPLLEDEELWHEVFGINLVGKDETEKKLDDLLSAHLDNVAKTQAFELKGDERQQIFTAMMGLAKRLDAWSGLREGNLSYQLHIAEAPAAVTWKEYDEFLAALGKAPGVATADKWIQAHCLAFGHSRQDVFGDLFTASANARYSALSRAVGATTEKQMQLALESADRLLGVIQMLTFEVGMLKGDTRLLTAANFKAAFESFKYYAESVHTQIDRDRRASEAAYLCRFIREWTGEAAELVKVLEPFSSSILHGFEGKEAKALHGVLCALAVPRYARELVARFAEQGFAEQAVGNSEGSCEIRCVLLDQGGPLWKEFRKETMDMLSTASNDAAVQHNIHTLLTWFAYKIRREQGLRDTIAALGLLKDPEIGRAIWNAATAQPLNLHGIAALLELTDTLKTLGVEVELPEWWSRGAALLSAAQKKEAPDATPPPASTPRP